MPGSKLDLKKKRIRAFFLTFETKSRKKGEIYEIQDEIIKEGMVYVQMRLPVDKITKEFQRHIRNKVEHNILHAKIREATEEDLVAMRHLYNRAWLTSNTPFRPINVESLQKIFEDPDTVFLVAKVYGMDAGFVILDFEGENKEYGIIAGLGVIPRFQRKGLGTVLGMAAWEYFIKRGVKELRCEVYKDNKVSYSFIKWIGFEEFEEKVYRMEDFELEED